MLAHAQYRCRGMTPLAITLILVSTVTHAGWNLIGKRSESTAASFLIATCSGIILLSPALLLFPGILRAITPTVWVHLTVTGAFQTLYYGALAAGYRSGEMSIVYPYARSTPAILVAVVTLLSGGIDTLSAKALFGIALIVGGGYILPLSSLRQRPSRSRFDRVFAFAFVAAVGTAGYSIIDSRALAMLREASGAPASHVSLVYACFEALSSFVWLALYVASRASERRSLRERVSAGASGLVGSLSMGVGVYLTYSLVLMSMAFVRDVSYVVAFRQLSIPVGVVMSRIAFGEQIRGPKAAGTFLMVAGVILVGLG
jgi:drug/metabolite transporter (DMT)-like permease